MRTQLCMVGAWVVGMRGSTVALSRIGVSRGESFQTHAAKSRSNGSHYLQEPQMSKAEAKTTGSSSHGSLQQQLAALQSQMDSQMGSAAELD